MEVKDEGGAPAPGTRHPAPATRHPDLDTLIDILSFPLHSSFLILASRLSPLISPQSFLHPRTPHRSTTQVTLTQSIEAIETRISSTTKGMTDMNHMQRNSGAFLLKRRRSVSQGDVIEAKYVSKSNVPTSNVPTSYSWEYIK